MEFASEIVIAPTGTQVNPERRSDCLGPLGSDPEGPLNPLLVNQHRID